MSFLFEEQDAKILFEKFFNLKGRTLSANWSLGKTKLRDYATNVIRFNFTREDASLYKCTSTNSVGDLEKTVSLNYFGELRLVDVEQVKCDAFTFKNEKQFKNNLKVWGSNFGLFRSSINLENFCSLKKKP